ncbi:MAG: amino acid ABC transporter substrate-binding protein [Acetobacteraceae bacterium]
MRESLPGAAMLRFAFAFLLLSALPAIAGTLDTVRSRGVLICGVNTGVAGFSAPDKQGVYRGLDVDYCHALAAATLGDPAKVKFVSTTYATRFVALQGGEIDILARNVTITLTRETSVGLLGIGVNFYDGQGFMVPKATNVAHATDLNGATVCVLPGSTTELNLNDFARRNNLRIQPVVLDAMDTMAEAYQAGRCDSMTTDASQLAALRVSAMRDPAAHVILPERVSKEPLGPLVRRGDEQWATIARYVLMAMIQAEELGVTQANVDEKRESKDPDVRRLLGVEPGLGKALGVQEDWAYRALKAVGNYGESFDRNLGKGSPIGLERGLNDLWTRGGLMYAIPMR